MENGLQTHTLPSDSTKLKLIAERVRFATGSNIEKDLERSMKRVRRIFERVFDSSTLADAESSRSSGRVSTKAKQPTRSKIEDLSPPFASLLANAPLLSERAAKYRTEIGSLDLRSSIFKSLEQSADFRSRLDALRREWTSVYIAIGLADLFEEISVDRSKALQTTLAEVSLDAAMHIVQREMPEGDIAPRIAVIALGKLGGQRLDFGSDLDIILSYDPEHFAANEAHQEYFSRAAELFINALSSMTRAGSLYRVDLRLRPFGSKGLSIISTSAFVQYMSATAGIWELLAYVKVRGIESGSYLDSEGAGRLEAEIRKIVHSRGSALSAEELRDSTLNVREALRKQRTTARRGVLDIKYDEGGMLDVYFAMRFLQLRDGILDDDKDRSTPYTLKRLFDAGSLCKEDLDALLAGHSLLSSIDHATRLCIGRSTRLPVADSPAMDRIVRRLKYDSTARLLEDLTVHRIAIREAYESILR